MSDDEEAIRRYLTVFKITDKNLKDRIISMTKYWYEGESAVSFYKYYL